MPLPRRILLSGGALALAGLAISGCTATTPAADGQAAPAAIGSTDLSSVCPATVVVQTNWNPEGEHGPLYELVGPDPTIDASGKLVTGPLTSSDGYTGVAIEVRAGGPAIGYQTVPTQLYTDPDILLGYVEITEAVQNSDALPTTAVFAQFDKDPGAVMWDPATYPDVESIADLAAAGAPLLTFEGANSTEWIVDAGIYPPDLIDRSYDGTPANFVAAGGSSAQAGYATAEPYIYANDLEAWNTPLDFQLYADAGWPNYANTLSIRSGDLEANRACLTELVPLLQQAELDYIADPEETNILIEELVTAYDSGWVYSKAVADYAASEMRELGLVGNGENSHLGDLDDARVEEIIDLMIPILDETGMSPAPGLQSTDLYTNEFLDESLGFSD